jgi:hypothetical protein
MSRKPSPPSETQIEVIRTLSENGGTAERRPGGFWTFPGCPEQQARAQKMPAWYFSEQTLEAMESRGWLQRVQRFAEKWRDDRELTPEGRALLVQGRLL